MSKKTVRIISTIITIAMMLMLSTSVVFAAENNTIGGVSINTNLNTNTKGISNITAVGNNILGMIRVVGTIIAVGVLMVLGIKYMMGSAEEKASYKKTMIPYLVGAILIFAASNIAKYVYEFVSGSI